MNTHLYNQSIETKIKNVKYTIKLSAFSDYKSIEVYHKEKGRLILKTHFNVIKGHPGKNPYYTFMVLKEEVKVYLPDINKYKDKTTLLKYTNIVNKKSTNYINNFIDELTFKMQIINECRI